MSGSFITAGTATKQGNPEARPLFAALILPGHGDSDILHCNLVSQADDTHESDWADASGNPDQMMDWSPRRYDRTGARRPGYKPSLGTILKWPTHYWRGGDAISVCLCTLRCRMLPG